MTPQEQKAAAKEFADYWKGKGHESARAQTFIATRTEGKERKPAARAGGHGEARV